MSKCLWSACVALSILGSGLRGASALAKPPDSPVDIDVEGAEVDTPRGLTLDFDLFTGKLSLSLSLPWNVWQSWLPEGLPNSKTTEFMNRHNAVCPPRECLVQNEPDRTTLQENQARTLFEIAERCLRNGDFDKARTCYEETHVLAPETPFGRQAIQRLVDIDNARINDVGASAEEQEPRSPAPRRFRN